MQNYFPVWKNVLVLTVLLIGLIYSLPNLYGNDPAVQLASSNSTPLIQSQADDVAASLKQGGFNVTALDFKDGKILARFTSPDEQMRASSYLKDKFGNKATVALNLAPATPTWLRALGAEPMHLGLDLRGGVHFLLEVDMDAAVKQNEERYVNDIRTAFRDAKVRYQSVSKEVNGIKISLPDNQEAKAAAMEVLNKDFRQLDLDEKTDSEIVATIPEREIRELKKSAIGQNITTLRNRINELGVAEPIIQQQGENRIVVQLPGVQDTAHAKELLGTTATLEYRLVDTEHDVQSALDGHVPVGSRVYTDKNGRPVLLKRAVIVTGDQITDASSGVDQEGSPAVFITLDSVGAKKMGKMTQDNIGKPMAVVFIEYKSETKLVDGQKVQNKEKVEKVISVATIRDTFSKRFQTTGLDNVQEARTLALLLRAGALAAPVEIVEERTVGPSLGQENIDQGILSITVGFFLVVAFMLIYYRGFGLIANFALFFNLIVLTAVLSILTATLTLPGMAGIVLTLGMAVDANVLINERIREELRNGHSPQSSIYIGYEKAFGTILDSNITTFLVGWVLFAFGTGPVKGFAVVLMIGIATSMFTAIMSTRMIVNWVYGGDRQIDKISL
jgi:preprotein translocase subunit SecD